MNSIEITLFAILTILLVAALIVIRRNELRFLEFKQQTEINQHFLQEAVTEQANILAEAFPCRPEPCSFMKECQDGTGGLFKVCGAKITGEPCPFNCYENNP